jgi:hypothetical protein
MFDIKTVEAEAKAEIAKERGEKAKGKIKESLRKIAQARQIVTNLEAEHAVLLADIGSTEV